MSDKVDTTGEDIPDTDTIELEFEEYEHEDYADEYDEEDMADSEIEQRVAEETWGLDPSMPLSREAADWYLLMSMWLDEHDDEDRFARRTSRLAEAFKDYADMVVGGELRYTLGHVGDPDNSIHPDLYQALRYQLNGGRSEAWDAWYGFRRKHKTNALYWAEDAFKAFGSHTYGGDKWSYIARTVRMYEDGEISAITFVDMCWGLEHNGGQFFGKLWNTYNLKYVLDANVHEEENKLVANASPSVAKLYTEVYGECSI